MNRHKLFYTKFMHDDDDDYYDDDDYDYDYDDYGYEESGNNAKEDVPPSSETTCPPKGHADANKTSAAHAASNALLSNDVDYSLVTSLLPEFRKAWNEKSLSGSTMPQESNIVQALRVCNYDVGEAVQSVISAADANSFSHSVEASAPVFLASDLRAKSQTKSPSLAPVQAPKTGGRTLKVGKEKSPEVTDDSKKPLPSNKPALCGNEKTKSSVSTGKLKVSADGIRPDTTKLDCTFLIAGHVDAGKSTTLGHLLLLLGRVSQTDVDKNERDGRHSNKESFKFAWLLDHSEEERRRGITIDSASHCFETEHRRIHILDAPGHRDFVMNMISSATQADAALLVVTAAASEFEVGLSHGTKDHLIILKILGVGRIVVAVNKMDAVDFSKERYDEIISSLQFLFKQIRFNSDAVVGFCPVSGMTGTNILEVDHKNTPWYNGPPLVQLLDQCPLVNRLLDHPVRLSLQDIDGSTLFCRVESGSVKKGATLLFMPPSVKVAVRSIVKPTTSGPVEAAFAGDTVEIHTNSSLVGLRPGCVGCPSGAAIRCSTDFEARIQTFASLQRSILPGTAFTMVVHALTVQVKVIALVSIMDKAGSWSKGMVKCVPKSAQALVVLRADDKIALEAAESCCALGRFVLLQDGNTVGGGLVQKVML